MIRAQYVDTDRIAWGEHGSKRPVRGWPQEVRKVTVEWVKTNHGWQWKRPGRPGYRGVIYYDEDKELFERALMKVAESEKETDSGKDLETFWARIARVFNPDGLWSCESCYWLDTDPRICEVCKALGGQQKESRRRNR